MSRIDAKYTIHGDSSYLNGELPLGEVDLALALLVGGTGSLVLGETAADLTSELGAEIEGSVLLALVEETELGALVGVDDGHHASNRLANIATVLKKIPGQYSENLDHRSISSCESVPSRVLR